MQILSITSFTMQPVPMHIRFPSMHCLLVPTVVTAKVLLTFSYNTNKHENDNQSTVQPFLNV